MILVVSGHMPRAIDDTLSRHWLAGLVHEAHGPADHPGIGEAEDTGDGPIGGNTPLWYLANEVIDKADQGPFFFTGWLYRVEA